jgi:glycerol uptake facilitator-like aquaporin
MLLHRPARGRKLRLPVTNASTTGASSSPPHHGVARRCGAEALGTALLVAAVIGSGIMATRLTEDSAVQLLVNALATVTALGVLIAVLGPISGAHFNPVVSLVELAHRAIRVSEAGGYLAAQVGGGLAGAALANVMFGLPIWGASTHHRSGWGLWLGELVATAGLLLTIGALTRTRRGHLGPVLVPAWIGAAYFFTSSTSFANPAVSIGRALSDSFAGIAPVSLPGFIVAQVLGAAVGAALTVLLFPRADTTQTLDLPAPVHEPEPLVAGPAIQRSGERHE